MVFTDSKFEAGFDRFLMRSPLQPLFLWQAAQKLTVLAYHGVDDPVSFTTHMDYIKNHLCPVSLQEVIDAVKGKTSLPKRAILITFDDGERSVLEQGMQILRAREMPAVVFVVAGLLDTKKPFWWVEVGELIRYGGSTKHFPSLDARLLVNALKQYPNQQRLAIVKELQQSANFPILSESPQLRRTELIQLERSGIAVGNHTMTHPCLSQCTTGEIEEEIANAHTILTETLGHHPLAFAYPNGNHHEHVERILTELGYEAGFLFDHRQNHLPLADKLKISRVRVNSYTSLERFKIIVSGLHPTLHQIRTMRSRKNKNMER